MIFLTYPLKQIRKTTYLETVPNDGVYREDNSFLSFVIVSRTNFFFCIKLKRSLKTYARKHTCTFVLQLVTDIKVEAVRDFDEHCGVARRYANKTIFKGGKRFPSQQLTSLSRILVPGL